MAWIDGGTLEPSKVGTKVNMVLFPTFLGPPYAQGWINAHSQKVLLPEVEGVKDYHSVSVYGFQVDRKNGEDIWTLRKVEGSVFFPNMYRAPESWFRTFSACSGMGGGIMGLSEQGFECVAACEKGPLAVESLQRNFDFKVIQADLGSTEALIEMHTAKGPIGGWLEVGFPCQPFSQLGDQRGFNDPRAWTFVKALQCSWSLQLNGLILECVPAVKDNEMIQKHLDELCRHMDLQKTEIILNLDSFWPCRRRRWWAILYPKGWKPIVLDVLPSSMWKTVGDLFPEWPLWSEDQEAQLAWTLEERTVFKDPSFGGVDRRLASSGVAPTILHSAGNHLGPCPCGCRPTGFSQDRLKSGGIHLIEIISKVDGSSSRHLHPQEAGLLLGVKGSYDYGDDMRGALSLLGQIASPVQAKWIGMHLQRAIAANTSLDLVEFEKELMPLSMQMYGDELISYSQASWTFSSILAGGQCTLKIADQIVSLTFGPGTTVKSLRQAQHALDRDSSDWQLYMKAVAVPDDALLRPGLYYVVQSNTVLPPVNYTIIEIDITYEGTKYRQLGRPGDFLFQFAPIDLRDDLSHWHFQTDYGTLVRWDQALYANVSGTMIPVIRGRGGKHAQTLSQLLKDEDLQGCLQLKHAGGSAPSLDEGLDDVTMGYCMRAMIAIADDPNIFWLEPRTVALWLTFEVEEAITFARDMLCDFDGDRILCLIGDDGHWAVLDYQMFDAGAEITYIDGIPNRLLAQATDLGNIIHAGFGSGPPSLTQATCFLQDGGAKCGSIALLHLGWRLHLWDDFTSSDVESWYHALRWGPTQPNFSGTGPHFGEWNDLRSLLLEKGVDQQHVDDRIQAAVKAFGQGKLQQAMKSRNVWQSLKALGSQKPKPFMWVAYDELQSHIAARGREKWGAEVDFRKSNRTTSRNDVKTSEQLIDPGKLQLVPGQWIGDGKPLPQLDFSQLKAGCSGVIFCKKEAALPYLQAGKTISVDPLLLLTVGQVDEPGTLLRSSQVEVPAKYSGTGEPILLRCTAIQLGDQDAVEHLPDHLPSIGTIPSVVFKIHWFRDECMRDWQDVCKRPIRHLVDSMPILQLCRMTSCDSSCPNFHPAVEEEGLDGVLIDMWSWKWCTLDGRKCKQVDAEVFQLFVRCPESLLEPLIVKSGLQGIFWEPRQSKGLGPHGNYALIWIAGVSLRQALHFVQTDEK